MLSTIAFLAISAQLDSVLDSPDMRGAVMGAIITDLSGNVLYERNSALRVMPASNQKLISCAYALHTLGADYIPQTRIWKEKNRVVVEATGDPSLTYSQLDIAKKKLKLTGKLPVYVKQAYRVGIPESWELDDLPNRYASPVSAFCFDQAAFELWAERGKAFLLPANFGVKISFDPALPAGASRYDPIRKRIRVGRNLPAKRTRLDTLALPSADESAAMVLGSKFYTTQSVPDRPADLVVKGQPLPEILKACLVKSDNIMAEKLLLMAAGKEGSIAQKPYDLARARVTKFLTETVGVQPEDLRIYDGSGLSRHNLVTSRGIAKLLKWSAEQPTADIWKASLVSPLNGTLKNRLKDVEFQGKTGTLDMVVSLSGYVKAKDGKEHIMSVLLNHFTCSSAKARDIADNFARTLWESSDGTAGALSWSHEDSSCGTFPSHLSSFGHRFAGFNHNSGIACAGSNSRT